MNIRKLQVLLTATALALSAGAPLQAQEVNISQHPLFLSSFVEPNVLFILDDSGSMHWETMPDEMTELAIGELDCTGDGNPGNDQTRCYAMWMYPITPGVHGDGDYAVRRVPRFEGNVAARLRSPQYNTAYYDPAVTYEPWIQADGAPMDSAAATAAYHNPVKQGLGTRNLIQQTTQTARWINDDGTDICHTVCANPNWTNNQRNACMNTPTSAFFCQGESLTFYPAVYYYYSGIGDPNDEANYERVEIQSGPSYTGHGRENRTDCNNGICSGEQEARNFANWYTYHRNRIFASRAGIGRAFSEQGERMRVGYGTINTPSNSVDGQTTQTVIHGVRRFAGNARDTFFTELYTRDLLDQWNRPQGTPLREALQGAGEYYSRSDDQGPWSATPGETGDEEAHLECRQSYVVLMTDGYWNQSGTIPGTGNPGTPIIPFDPVGNVDGTAGPNGYSPTHPFRDNHSDTLADVAMHYWASDLQGDLDDRVPTTSLNPANWQHMVTFGVGLGVTGTIDPPEEAFEAIQTGEEITWPNPLPDNAGPAKIDDLLHAAVNSRGGFFSAIDAEQFSRDLSRILRDIIARAGLVTGFAPSATRLVTDSLIFEANFDGEDWSGRLVAWDPEEDFSTPEWSAAQQLPHTRFLTWDGNNGDDFDTGANIDVEDDVILYIRGDQSQEEPAGPFRARESLLGDIINSQPTFSGPGNEGWARLGGDAGAAYVDYITNVKRPSDDGGERENAVFVGANDGMLHAFDAEQGTPLFAYVPRAVHDKLHLLTDPAYSHEYYVDGEITIRDACINTTCSDVNNWKTVLVGGLGAGGKGIFALDVTNPTSPNVLWEINEDTSGFVNEAGVPTLGHTFGAPAITRLHDGRFVAVFGNGYGSDSNQAWLYVVDLFSGEKISEIELATGDGAPQGLSGPRVWLHGATRVDANRFYAGDLQGNLWRVGVDDDGGLQSRFGNDPLFAAGEENPITVNPTLAVHPNGGLMVYFGTGKFFEEGDNEIDPNEPIQNFYAIRDLNQTVTGGIQSITMTEDDGMRIVDNAAAGDFGWRLRLLVGNNNVGERVLHTPRVLAGRVIFTTYEPELDVCGFGGTRRIYVLNAINGDGRIGVALEDGTPCSNCGGIVIEPGGGPIPPEVVIVPPGSSIGGGGSGWDSELGFLKPPTEDDDDFFGSLGTIREGRQVWRQIQ